MGNPISVRIDNVEICMDYFQAVDEATFISKNIDLSEKRVLEIGPGYGRTVHTLLSLNPNISEFYLLDLTPCLKLSQRYLENTLPKKLSQKIVYIDLNDFLYHIIELVEIHKMVYKLKS